MATRKPKIIPYRRKREQKTHYKKRLRLLTSERTRLVYRRFNNSFIGQLIGYGDEGDKVLVAVNSTELRKLGWNHGCGNISAAYLTGLLLGSKGLKLKIKDAILDIGMHHSIAGSRIYAFAKGVVDSGLQVPVSEEVFPSEDRITGKHIAAIAEKASSSQFKKKAEAKRITADFEKLALQLNGGGRKVATKKKEKVESEGITEE